MMETNFTNLSIIYIDTPSFEEMATFWIEGVLTPVVSLRGLIGKENVYRLSKVSLYIKGICYYKG